MDEKTAEMLNSLVQLEEDAVRAYDQASAACDVMAIKIELRELRGRHAQHARALAQTLLASGQHVVRRDEKGYLVEGFTPQMAGDEEVLRGVLRDEELLNRAYGTVLEHDLADDVRGAVERAYEEDKLNLAWIQSALADRVWEHAA